MKIFTFLFVALLYSIVSTSQTTQLSIGAAGSAEVFTDVKIDPADGSIINVGYINNGEDGNDCLITKMDASHQLIWQKVISNAGDDRFNRVSICSNGDYIVAGKIFQDGIIRGLVCRINSNDGNIIWSTSSSLIQTTFGEEFFDLIETVNHNIAVVGYTNYNPPYTRGIIILLNSAGQEIYTRISNYVENSTGFRTVNQLSNNNLIISGLYYIGYYGAVILEMNESDATVISQNTYAVSAIVPGIGTSINSLLSVSNNIVEGKIYYHISEFTGTGLGPVVQGIYEYDETTKNLSGNIFYHTFSLNATGFGFYPLAANDFLISQSFNDNTRNNEYVSRITNGSVVYDRRINGDIIVYNMDVSKGNLSLCGYKNDADLNAYELLSSDFNIPVSSGQCEITNTDSLGFIGNTLIATINESSLLTSTSMADFMPTVLNANITVTDICASTVPVTLINFKGYYKNINNTNQLEWSTASEFNSKNFIIEKSTDGGKTFSAVGTLTATRSGNSVVNYTFTDFKPVAGNNFYRLKETDIDNKFQYSKIISIVVPDKKSVTEFSFYPNPAKFFTNIATTSSDNLPVTIEVIDATGRVLRKNNDNISNAHPLKLDLNEFNKGMYFIRLSSEKYVRTQKIIVN